MKSIAKTLLAIFEGVGRARAATYYARIGRSDLARELMLKD